MARCIYCQCRSGFISQVCRDCRTLTRAFKTLNENFGYRELLDKLLDTGVDPDKIEKFLDTDTEGTGSISQRITARMTNQLMADLGQPTKMSGQDVKEVEKSIANGESYLDMPDVVAHPKSEPEEE